MWSEEEKDIARRAFDIAYEREVKELANKVREMANSSKTPEDIWELHDFLTEKRKQIDDKYDYRYSILIRVFGRLVREGWVTLDDLKGLEDGKVAKIKYLAGS